MKSVIIHAQVEHIYRAIGARCVKWLFVMLIVILGGSCTHHAPETKVDESFFVGDYAPKLGLRWLAAQQHRNGAWGAPPNQARLTSLAITAYFVNLETPDSKEFGRTVQCGLSFLLDQDIAHGVSLSEADQALRIWCLAEVYKLTKRPIIKPPIDAYFAQAKMSSSCSWRVHAGIAAYLGGADLDLGAVVNTSLQQLPATPTSVCDQATQLLLELLNEHKRPDQAAVHALVTADWRSAPDPMQTIIMQDHVLLAFSSIQDLKAWCKSYHSYILARQLRRGDQGWWTPADLGIANAVEFAGMTSNDPTIWVTSGILCTAVPFHLPNYRPLYIPALPEHNALDL